LNKFLNLNPSDSNKVLNSYKLKKEKANFLNKQESKNYFTFYKKLFSYQKKVLDFKILVFFQLVANVNKFNNKFMTNVSSKKKKVYLYKSVHIFARSAFVLLSLLNSNAKVNGNKLFTTKKKVLAFIQYFRHNFYSVLNIYNVGFKLCYYKLTLKYFMFLIYFDLKKYLDYKSMKQGVRAQNNVENTTCNLSIKPITYTKSNIFYKNIVYKSLGQFKKNSINTNSANLDYKICRKQLFKKKFFLDDKRYFKIQSLIRNFLKFKKVENINISQLIYITIKNVMPIYKLVHQRRGRNKILVAKYLFINKIRESLAIKQLLKNLSVTSDLNKEFRKNSLEYKITLALLDSFFCRGVVFENKKKSQLGLKGNIFNKGQLLKTIKPFLKKK